MDGAALVAECGTEDETGVSGMGFNVGAWMDARQGAGRVQSSAEASILRTQYVWNVYRHKGPKNASPMPEAASVPRFVFGNPRGIRGAKF